MGCKECGKPKCNGECGCKSPKVLQINNPAEYITFHKVSIPAAMGDSTTNPPKIGAYRNALVYYEADHTSWMYSTDGIPTLITGEKGETGPQGIQGIQGEPGPQGIQGIQGIQGEPGPQGYMNEQDVRGIVDTIVPEGFFDAESTVSGCGTSFELNGVIDGQPKSLQINGDTYQQTYEGKNLFNDNTAIDAFIQKNGDVTPNTAWRSSQLIKVEPNTSYAWSGEVYGTHQVVWAGYDSSQAFVPGQYAQVNNVSSLIIITGENTEYIRVGYRSDGMRKMQLELGSTASNYEPYVGGVPSPNPDYPQPIQTVTGEQTVEIVGKNLFNNEPNTNSNLNVTTNNQVTRVVKDITSWWNLEWSGDKLNLVPGETYTARLFILDNPKNYAGTINLWFDIQGKPTAQTVELTAASGYQKTFTYEITQQLLDLRAAFGANEAGIDITFCIQIEKGSTATAFVPYSNQTYEINLGKNLFDKSAQIVNGYTYAGNGSLTTLGNCSVQEAYISVKPSTAYTLHTEVTSSQASNFRVYICEYDSGKGFIKRNVPKPVESSTNTITTTANTHFVRLCFSTICIDTLQFEAGSTATTYAPYFEPIELCKLGTYQDYIWKDGKDWKIHKATTTETLNGSEDWEQDSSGGYQRFNIIRQNAVSPSGRTATGLSSHFTSKTTDGIGIFFLAPTSSGTTRRFFFYPESNITTVESFKSWLNSNNTTLLYPLATPTDTVITDQTLIAQLDAIRLDSGANTISVSSSEVNGELCIEAYSDNWNGTISSLDERLDTLEQDYLKIIQLLKSLQGKS